MAKPSKRSTTNAALAAAHTTPKSVEDAVGALKQFKATKFDQTVEVCVHLGIDPRQAEQQIRGSISMPRGVGKSARVICFCGEDKVESAKGAGAIEAGGEELVKRIEGGWMEFDVAVASPDMMRVVSKLGRVLGPKGLMPSPKAGTVTPDVVTAVREYGAGRVEYRNDDGGNVHCIIGRMSFTPADLVENLRHFISTIERIKPPSAKGQYIRKCVISATMTPSVMVQV